MFHDSHHLLPAKLAELHPTQITVGLAEWARLKRRARAHLLAAHWFPAVKGPGGRFYIVDHHHLGLALQQEQIAQVWVMQLDDFSELKGETFWRLMEFRRWAHPYDQRGQRRDYSSIPGDVSALRLQVIAEGVETEAQRECLSRLGCNEYQGWLYAPALEPKAFEERVWRRRGS